MRRLIFCLFLEVLLDLTVGNLASMADVLEIGSGCTCHLYSVGYPVEFVV